MEKNNQAFIDLALGWKNLFDRHSSTFTPTPRCHSLPPVRPLRV